MIARSVLGTRKAKTLAMNEKLCANCLEREGAKRKDAEILCVNPNECTLCEGLTAGLDQISSRAIEEISDYEFDTFLVGALFPQALLDKEDEIRSRFKIRGREGLKTQTTKSITKIIQRRLGKRVEYSRPDLTLLVSFVDGSIVTTFRSIWISSSYTKKERGIAQRTSVCRVCNGVGCTNCEYKGSITLSVESIVSDYLKGRFRAEGCNFIWIGSEDSRSLVGGNGRPFFAEIVGPRRRRARLGGKRIDLGKIEITRIEVLPSRPRSIPQFLLRCIVYLVSSPSEVKAPSEIDSSEIEKFRDVTVNVQLYRKFKVTKRRVHTVAVRKGEATHPIALEIVCEGGIPIRKLVTGEDGTVSPNLSEFIKGYSIDPLQPFDILDLEILKETKTAQKSNMRRKRAWHRPHRAPAPIPPSENEYLEEMILEN